MSSPLSSIWLHPRTGGSQISASTNHDIEEIESLWPRSQSAINLPTVETGVFPATTATNWSPEITNSGINPLAVWPASQVAAQCCVILRAMRCAHVASPRSYLRTVRLELRMTPQLWIMIALVIVAIASICGASMKIPTFAKRELVPITFVNRSDR
jgi:hypothetical protein